MNDYTLEKLKKTQIEILDEIVRICKNHNLTYFLISGTLLGAVRHKGFIPWDKDIDIAMPRNDFEKLRQLSETELNSKYFFQDCRTDPSYYLSFAKVRKNNTLYEESYTEKIDTHKGIFIDIFILDNAKKQKGLLQHLQGFFFWLFRYIIWVKRVVKTYKPKKPLHLICYILSLPIPYGFAVGILQKIMSYNKNEKSAYFVNLTSRRGYVKQTIKKEKYLPAVQLEFEGKMYDAPCDWDYILTRIYSDYIKIPNEDEIEYPNKIKKIEFELEGKRHG